MYLQSGLNPKPSSSFLFSHGSWVFRPVTIKGLPSLVLLGVFVGLRLGLGFQGSRSAGRGVRGSIHSRGVFWLLFTGPGSPSCVSPFFVLYILVYCGHIIRPGVIVHNISNNCSENSIWKRVGRIELVRVRHPRVRPGSVHTGWLLRRVGPVGGAGDTFL